MTSKQQAALAQLQEDFLHETSGDEQLSGGELQKYFANLLDILAPTEEDLNEDEEEK